MKKFWELKAAAAGKNPELLIYQYVGDPMADGIGAIQIHDELKALGEIPVLDIRINSKGGEVFEGFAIYNMLKSFKARKDVYIDGIAASISSVIAMAGDNVYMPKNAAMMIHEASGMNFGTAQDMRSMADALDRVNQGILAAYQDKSGMVEKDVRELIAHGDRWLSAQEAVELGLVDKVIDPLKAVAFYNTTIPDSLLAKIKQEMEDNPTAAAAARRRKLQLLETQ